MLGKKRQEIMMVGKDMTQHPLPNDKTVKIIMKGNPVGQIRHFAYLRATIKIIK
jgi:hypothetical protein